MKAVRLHSRFLEKIWGTTEVDPWFTKTDKKIGEVWFTWEPELPLLIKFLFTSGRLSVQLHPDDADGEAGKTEMWHILRAEPGATIALGFREPVTRTRLREAALTGEIERLLRWIPVKPGETYFIPAHTVHALGGGIAVLEIQQQSDCTYRLYDYGRDRELHLERGVALADLGVYPDPAAPEPTGPGRMLLARCPYFETESIQADRELAFPSDPQRFQVLIVLEGQGTLGDAPVRHGEAWMIPACSGTHLLRPESPMRLIRTAVPPAR